MQIQSNISHLYTNKHIMKNKKNMKKNCKRKQDWQVNVKQKDEKLKSQPKGEQNVTKGENNANISASKTHI